MNTRSLVKHNGFTLIEVTLAMALTAMICIGVIAVGLKGRRFTEHSRIASEARSLAKERLEEMVTIGCDTLALPTCMLLQADTNLSTFGSVVLRHPRVGWHAADRSLTNAAAADYAELHVDVVYISPLLGRSVTDTLSTIVY
jgi:type II secretory pathway pseudopilin PulG